MIPKYTLQNYTWHEHDKIDKRRKVTKYKKRDYLPTNPQYMTHQYTTQRVKQDQRWNVKRQEQTTTAWKRGWLVPVSVKRGMFLGFQPISLSNGGGLISGAHEGDEEWRPSLRASRAASLVERNWQAIFLAL